MTTTISATVAFARDEVFTLLGLSADEPGTFDGTWKAGGTRVPKFSPIDGSVLGHVIHATSADYERAAAATALAFLTWREIPAPRRGEYVRRFSERLRTARGPLARLITLEAGKIPAEGEGEVQEMIDICEYAVGLSRQLHGVTLPSERPGHRIIEQWHPAGPVGCITAFNFPTAVWTWNFAIAAVCGDSVLWKPSEKTPFTALACVKLAHAAARDAGVDPAIATLVIGGGAMGAALAADGRFPVVSATGSVAMGRKVGVSVAQRLGRSILELGGNNAVIVTAQADLDLTAKAVFFGAVGTAGQRCTSTRRLIVHRAAKDALLERLKRNYSRVPVGSPLEPGVLVGPLIDADAGARMESALDRARVEGGQVLVGGEMVTVPGAEGGCYMRPTIVDMPAQTATVREETFAPILYVLTCDSLEEALTLQNGVTQGLSSAIFTNRFDEAERFLGPAGVIAVSET